MQVKDLTVMEKRLLNEQLDMASCRLGRKLTPQERRTVTKEVKRQVAAARQRKAERKASEQAKVRAQMDTEPSFSWSASVRRRR